MNGDVKTDVLWIKSSFILYIVAAEFSKTVYLAMRCFPFGRRFITRCWSDVRHYRGWAIDPIRIPATVQSKNNF